MPQGDQEIQIDVPGVGLVSFPANMSDNDIERSIKTKIIPQGWKENPEAMLQAFTTPEQQKNLARSRATLKQEEAKAPTSKDPGFWSTLGTGLAEMGAHMALAPLHPWETMKGAAQDYMKGVAEGTKDMQQARAEAWRDLKAGRMKDAFGNATAATAASVGRFSPAYLAAKEAGKHFGEQGIGSGQAWGETAMVLGPDALGLALSGTTKLAKAGLKSRLSPTLEARRAEFVRRGGKLSFGQERGIQTIEKGERTLRHVPGGAAPAERFYGPQEEELERQARESTSRVSRTQITKPEDAAQAVYNEASGWIRQRKRLADRVYDNLRAIAKKDTQTLPIGRKPIYGPNGQLLGYQTIYGTYQAPLSLKPFRAGLADLYQEFETKYKSLSESEKLANPGYMSLRRFMTETDPLTGQLRRYMGAMDLESELANIKWQLREGMDSSMLYKPAGRVALRIIDEGEKAIAKALDRAQPGGAAMLRQGQDLVRSYKTADRLVTRIVGKGEKLEPGKFYNFMTETGVRNLGALRRLNVIAPNSSKALARTYLEGLLTTSTAQTGRLTGTKALLNGFTRLDQSVRELWFGKALNKELEDAFRNIHDLVPAEGSQTAWRIPILAVTGELGTAIGLLIGGHPGAAAATVGLTAANAAGFNILARILFREGGPTLLRNVLTLPWGGAFREAARAFTAQAGVEAESIERDRVNKVRAAYRSGQQNGGSQPAPASAPAPSGQQQPPEQQPPAPARDDEQPSPAPPDTPAPPAQGGADRDYSSAYREFGRIYGVPPSILHAVAKWESGENPNAVGKSGDVGIMQLMPGTARSLRVADRRDAYQSIRAAARLLADLKRKYGTWQEALDAYNQGEPSHNRRRRQGEASPSHYSRGVMSLARNFPDEE